jgi:hypothetical protein
MKDTALELYIYMNSWDKVIEHLEKKGVKTKDDALVYLRPYVRSNIFDSMRLGGSLAGTAACVERVVKHFEKKK